MNTLSIVIPITDFTGQPWREKALEHVIKRIGEELPSVEVVISKGEAGTNFCKAKLVNDGVRQAKGDVVLILDSDVVLDWKTVAKQAYTLKHGVVCKPFSTIIRMTEDMTKKAYETGRIRIPPNVSKTNAFGGGALLLFKSDFDKVGGFCEEFIGWGLQDIDFGDRLREVFNVVELDSRGLHLYHPRNPDELLKSASFLKNKDLYTTRRKNRRKNEGSFK